MFLAFVGDIMALLGILVIYGSPFILIGLILFFFLKGREKTASITDWKDDGKK